MKFWPPPLELCPQWPHIVWLMRATSHNRAPGDHQFIFMLHVFLSICGHNFTCLHLLSSSKYYNNGHNFPLVTFSGFHTSDTFVVGLVTFSTIVICLVANTWHGGLHSQARFPMSNSIEVLPTLKHINLFHEWGKVGYRSIILRRGNL